MSTNSEVMSWVPVHCPNGHELHYGTQQSRVSLSWASCRCPRGIRSDPWAGHHNVFCKICNAEMRPPGCDQGAPNIAAIFISTGDEKREI